MIRQAGAKEVHFRVASAPITGPCYYGIDTPTKSELIASSHSLEQIRQHLAVDTLGYLSLEGMKRAAGGDSTEFCHACFSGEYPTEIPDDTQKARNATPLQCDHGGLEAHHVRSAVDDPRGDREDQHAADAP